MITRSSRPGTATAFPQRRTPKQARSQQTLEAILEATAQVLQHEGEAAFNTNRIAERAGVSIGTLYQYFPDKAAILAHLALRWRNESIRLIDLGVADAMTTGADASGLTRAIVRPVLQCFGGTAETRALVRLAWLSDSEGRVSHGMQITAERIGLLIQPLALARGMSVAPEQVYLATRAVLGTIRFASIEDSPLLLSPTFEDGLVRMALAVLLPPDNPPHETPVHQDARRRQ